MKLLIMTIVTAVSMNAFAQEPVAPSASAEEGFIRISNVQVVTPPPPDNAANSEAVHGRVKRVTSLQELQMLHP